MPCINLSEYWTTLINDELLLIENIFTNTLIFICRGCGLVADKFVTSPGYPESYPSNMHCVYQVEIAPYSELNITFSYFNLEESGSW